MARQKRKFLKLPSGVSTVKQFLFQVFNSDNRQADKNGDGKLSLEEIIDIFKVELYTESSLTYWLCLSVSESDTVL